jgi:hypothetical protein
MPKRRINTLKEEPMRKLSLCLFFCLLACQKTDGFSGRNGSKSSDAKPASPPAQVNPAPAEDAQNPVGPTGDDGSTGGTCDSEVAKILGPCKLDDKIGNPYATKVCFDTDKGIPDRSDWHLQHSDCALENLECAEYEGFYGMWDKGSKKDGVGNLVGSRDLCEKVLAKLQKDAAGREK